MGLLICYGTACITSTNASITAALWPETSAAGAVDPACSPHGVRVPLEALLCLLLAKDAQLGYLTLPYEAWHQAQGSCHAAQGGETDNDQMKHVHLFTAQG